MKRAAVLLSASPMAESDRPGPMLVQRPDGWYWQTDDGRREIGPFASAEDALAATGAGEEGLEPGGMLREVEDEIGVADWIDPDTHEPAEHCVPHIEDR